MVLVKTPLDFIERSIQLLQAHPNTTRITTTYNIQPTPTTPSRRPKPSKPTSTSSSTAAAATAEEKPKAPRGRLTLKTYDPISGSIIKLRTDKISDVGRIVTGLHRLGRSMAGLKDLGSGEVAGATEQTAVVQDAPVAAAGGASAAAEGAEAAAGGSGSKGGKKKNKKKK
ncbi:hypothetical protein TWF730_000686 [Orbilia blumenaviensis]|uniref:SRP9 domain-containing protein n=1 Tax=Orbilia blumenaviensis TaxID=1796055 RepID=A0AAV9VPL0_9PEZI